MSKLFDCTMPIDNISQYSYSDYYCRLRPTSVTRFEITSGGLSRRVGSISPMLDCLYFEEHNIMLIAIIVTESFNLTDCRVCSHAILTDNCICINV